MLKATLYVAHSAGGCQDCGTIQFEGFQLISNEEIAELKTQIEELKTERNKLKEMLKNAESDAKMYADAWQRELLDYDGKVINKRHHIDSMVLSTKSLINRLKSAEARVSELEALDLKDKDAQMNVPGFVPDHVKLLFEAYQYGQFADDFNYPIVKPIRAAIRQLLDELLVSTKP